MQLCALDWILEMEKGSISAEPQQMLHSVHIVGKHSLEWPNRRRCVSLPVVRLYARFIAMAAITHWTRSEWNAIALLHIDHLLDIDCRTRSGCH